ncbi:hypothetical protein BC834DRAFT_842156 [Gloeopeniophorella convolvens]|nr:hypothetical protein BC834DRAFT_842156 [Gloeopeniophorella convolvens]
MTNWQDPARIAADYFTGAHEADPRHGRHSHLYLGCRWSSILCVALMLVGFDVGHKIDCEAQPHSSTEKCAQAFGCLTFILASALIVLRIAAIWNYNRVAVGLASTAWLASTGSYVHKLTSGCTGTVTVRAIFNPQNGLCAALDFTGQVKLNILVMLVADISLLGLMLGGLFRWSGGWRAGGIRRFIYKQSLVWLVVVTLSEIPTAMSQIPALVIMALGTAHIYRGLAEYSSQDIMCMTSAESGRASERPVPVPDASSEQTFNPLVYVVDNLPVPDMYGGDKMTKVGEKTVFA